MGMMCPDHPRYQAKKRPTSGCRVCMKLWATRFPDRAREYRNARRRWRRDEARIVVMKPGPSRGYSYGYCDDNERIYSDGWYKN